MINVTVNGTQIIKKRDINIGMAAALPSGNLIVPVIKNADQLKSGWFNQSLLMTWLTAPAFQNLNLMKHKMVLLR